MTALIYSMQSEWLKRRRSLASWLVIVGAFFTPAIVTLVQVLRPAKVPAQFSAPDFWEAYYKSAWQSMVAFLLPMGITLAVSLVTQLEYKDNAWKQLHTTPQSLTTIFFSKWLVLLIMMLQLFLLFNFAIYLSAVVTASLLSAVDFPTAAFPLRSIVKESALFFIDCLPIVAIQYLLSLLFRNFLVAVGTGMIMLVTNLVLISWERAYIFPYSYGLLDYLGRFKEMNLQVYALSWFAAVMLIAYILYLRKPDKT